jgi:hypothetical protein
MTFMRSCLRVDNRSYHQPDHVRGSHELWRNQQRRVDQTGAFPTLFNAERDLRAEINRRAWEYLKLIGYEWYKTNSISVIMLKRGKVDIIQIRLRSSRITSIQINSEVTLTIFERTLQRDIEGV